jgi:hypothetical protein
MGEKSVSGSGMNNADHISENLETVFWVKFLDADPGWKTFLSGIRDGKIRIRDSGSATLKGRVEKNCVFHLLRHASNFAIANKIFYIYV